MPLEKTQVEEEIQWRESHSQACSRASGKKMWCHPGGGKSGGHDPVGIPRPIQRTTHRSVHEGNIEAN
jgi:hypothetical protein